MKTWHYADRQNRAKRVLEDELTSLANSGEVRPDTLVWTSGMAAWAPAGETIPELFDDDTGGAPPPSLPASALMGPRPGQRCDEIDYELLGGDMQIVEVELDPGETVIAEAGAMNYLEEDVEF